MLPREDLLSDTAVFVSDGRQTIPIAGFADLEPGHLLGISTSSLVQVPLSSLGHRSLDPLPPTPILNIRALHDNIPVADEGLPPADTPPNRTLRVHNS